MSARWTIRALSVIVVLLVVSSTCFVLSLLVPGGSDLRALVAASINVAVAAFVGRTAVELRRRRGRT